MTCIVADQVYPEVKALVRVKVTPDMEGDVPHGTPGKGAAEIGLDRVGMDHDKKLQLEGHSQGVRLHYTDRYVEELRSLYQQAYQYLDLSEEASAGVRELEKLVGEQQKHIESLKADLGVKDVLLKRVLDEIAALRKKWEEFIRQSGS